MVHLPPKPSVPLLLLLASLFDPSTALPHQPRAIQDQTSQVSINSPDTEPPTSSLPITLTIFSSSPGPKLCRGHVIASLTIPTPEGLGLPTTRPECYNLPAAAPAASCGTFVANKEDGCEVRLFAGWDCVEFVNLAVFMPEVRPVGGRWRSFEVRCGVEPPLEGALGRPPLEGMIEGIKRPHRR
ncbi:hypothetical protein GE09DRAFT_282751 [Coniochaeta sp. 2T2.1]|nr:hypothetical protein GE09DRAFT_282751 [Coniochaeta sp. 2T2.1]